MTKALFVVAQTKGVRDGALVLAFPSKVHADKAAKYQGDIERALGAAVGTPAKVVIEGDATAAAAGTRVDAPEPTDEDVDPSEFVEDSSRAVSSNLDRIIGTFPGSNLMTGDN
jgi:hypothetical protein